MQLDEKYNSQEKSETQLTNLTNSYTYFKFSTRRKLIFQIL